MIEEFKKFIAKGNVMDMAVGVIIGAAFGKIVTSLVEDVIMPPIGALMGKVDFTSLFINLSGQTVTSLEDAKAKGLPVIGYGAFLNTIISFLIVAVAVFFLVKAVNRVKAAPVEEAPAAPSEEVALLTEIRDLMAKP